MLTHPLTLMPLLALGLALGWTAWRPGTAPAAAALLCTAWLLAGLTHRWAAQQRQARETGDALARRCAEQEAAIGRAEAARAAAAAEARALEQRFALAVRGSLDGVWEWDLARDAVQLSPRWKGMLGYAADELADARSAWLGRVHADDRAGFEQALGRPLADGAPPDFEHEMRLLHKDGSVRWVLSRGTALRRASGAVYRLIGMDVDITRVRRMRSVLEAVAAGTADTYGESFFAALVEHFARALGVGCAFVTECCDQPPTRVRSLGHWSDGAPREPFEYALAGTPCEEVIEGRRLCFHRRGVGQRFPCEAGYEAYLGVPIVGRRGQVLGHLAFLHPQPLGDEMLVEAIYRIFTARAAAELELRHAEARLRQLQALPDG